MTAVVLCDTVEKSEKKSRLQISTMLKKRGEEEREKERQREKKRCTALHGGVELDTHPAFVKGVVRKKNVPEDYCVI